MQVDVLTMPTVTVNAHAVTNAGTFAVQVDGAALTALQLIDDPVAVLGTATYTEATTSGMIIGAVRRDADTTLVNTTNEISPLQVDANGRLKVEAFSGEALPVTFTGSTDVATQTTLASLLTSSQLIDDAIFVDDTATHATGTTKGVGIMAVANPTDAAVDANDIGMVAMTLARAMKNDITTIAGTAPTTAGFIDIKGADGNVFVRQATAANLNMTEASASGILTSVQLIDDAVFTDDTSTHATGTTKGIGIMAAATPTDTAVNANDIGMVGMTNNREMYVSLRDIAGATAVSGSGNATGALRVELANNGTGNISTVAAVTSITNSVTVVGGAANASPVSGNPVLAAGRASTAVPTDVGADGDAASLWTNRNGALVATAAPHVGILGTPWDLVHEAAQYTSTQTSTVLVAGGASEKIVVTKVQIQAFGTTAFDLQLYFGTGAFSRGTSRACFDGTFKPSSTLAPGAILDGPFISGTNGDDLMVTTSAAGSVTINVWYYIVT
jgi:hypothetical protein